MYPARGWVDNEGMDRLQYYNFYDWLDAKKYTQNVWIRRLVNLQKNLGIKRNLSNNLPKIYGGSTWWSLSRKGLEYVLKFTRANPEYLKRFRHTLCAEEFYVQTILMNSPLSNRVMNKNLRYIDWVARNGNKPAVLDMDDFKKISQSDAVFARKFDKEYSWKLFEKINKNLLK